MTQLMVIDWTHAWPTVLAAFLASVVEFVEALTVVLAVGTVRGWRGAIAGPAAALACLIALVLVLGPTLTLIPLDAVQLVVGGLLLLFGLRWLRKAVLRSAGVIPLHDETATFAKETEALRGHAAHRGGWDAVAIGTAFKITMLEGLEVVFIVVAVGAGGTGLLIPASLGAVAALMLVIAVGILVHRPLASIPENTLKFGVGVLLSGFGIFWVGEGMGLAWPAADWSIPALCVGFLAVALAVGAGAGAAVGAVGGICMLVSLKRAFEIVKSRTICEQKWSLHRLRNEAALLRHDRIVRLAADTERRLKCSTRRQIFERT